MPGKRIIAAVLLAAMLCLCACGLGEMLPATPAAQETPAAETPVQETAVPVTEAPAAEPEQTPVTVTQETPQPEASPAPVILRVTELMANNVSCYAYQNGFPDWLEVYNAGTEAVSTAGLTLLADGKELTMPEITVAAGEYGVLCFVNGGLKKGGGTLTLKNGSTVVAELSYPETDKDESCTFDEDGTPTVCALPTPGYENTDAGYLALQEAAIQADDLVINEVMVYNDRFSLSGSYCDWAELRNNSTEALNTGDYYLSDKSSDPKQYRLPETILQPGEIMMVCLTGEDGSGAPFALDAHYDKLYLTRVNGTLADCMTLRGIPSGGSVGREAGKGGMFYYTAPTPGKENSGGIRLVAEKPVALSPDGVFEGVESVTVALDAKGTIYYTTDGSTPDESDLRYAGPFTVSATTVIRAINVEEGKITSEPALFSYIVNEKLTLPVVSMVTDRENLYGSTGIYSYPTQDWERSATVEYINGDEGFTIDCGIKMHGATSRFRMTKKTFKLCFRSRYDGQLEYDLFGNGVTEYASLLLRYAQEDDGGTQMRDVLLQSLIRECCPDLPTQDYQYAIFFLNGEYWGIYAIREAHSATHYANHYGYDVDSVTMWQEIWDSKSLMGEVYQYLMSHDMADPEYYAYVASHIDIESTIAWTIIESYGGNTDLNSPNVRFYYSEEDQKMRFALVDLDACMYAWAVCKPSVAYSGYDFANITGRLMRNAEYRALLLQRMSEYLQGPLSDDNVSARVEALNAILAPEMDRDAARWGRSRASYDYAVNAYQRFIYCGKGRANQTIQYLNRYLNITNTEWQTWFSWTTR